MLFVFVSLCFLLLVVFVAVVLCASYGVVCFFLLFGFAFPFCPPSLISSVSFEDDADDDAANLSQLKQAFWKSCSKTCVVTWSSE